MSFDLQRLVRTNIRSLVPYSSARSEFTGQANVFLDANENSFGSPMEVDYHRYPDPLQSRLKDKIAESNDLDPAQIFVGNGSDEAIDLLMRIFCEPGRDEMIICPPTYGMYEVSAVINGVEVVKAPLTTEFHLDVDMVTNRITDATKLIFLCSPNNPTGNAFPANDVLQIASSFDGIVVVDEAYIHFADKPSLVKDLTDVPNLVILQTLSKAWGLAGLRIGIVFADAELITLLNAVKPPYNVSQPAQDMAFAALQNTNRMRETIAAIIRERQKLAQYLTTLNSVQAVFPSDANFLLVRVHAPDALYDYLLKQGVVVRDRSKVELCEGCLRITVGTPDENAVLMSALKRYEEGIVY